MIYDARFRVNEFGFRNADCGLKNQQPKGKLPQLHGGPREFSGAGRIVGSVFRDAECGLRSTEWIIKGDVQKETVEIGGFSGLWDGSDNGML
jgi:hypothetical protein